MEFFETILGKRFYEGQVPKMIKALEDIATELKRANDLKEKELKFQESEKQVNE